MKLPDAIKWRAHNLYIAYDTELFDKPIKPWKLQVLFLHEQKKQKQKQETKKKTRTLQWPWFSNRSPTAGFHHNFFAHLGVFDLGKSQTTPPGTPCPTFYE